MRKDSSRKRYSDKRALKQKRRRMIYISLFLVLLGCIGAGIYYVKDKPFVASAKSWLVERKSHLQKGVVKVKQLAANKETPPEQIHFDFYTALPNMHIEPSQPKPPTEREANDK
jgi:hypothetical protein